MLFCKGTRHHASSLCEVSVIAQKSILISITGALISVVGALISIGGAFISIAGALFRPQVDH